MANNFKAGSTTSHELAGWQPPVISPEDEARDYGVIKGRVMDLARNNPYVAGAVEFYKDAVVGHRFKLSLRPDYRVLGISHEAASEWASLVESQFHLWADDPECWIDAQRKKNFTQICRQSVASDYLAGEFMLSRQWRPDVRTPYATCFSIVEPERVCNPLDKDYQKRGLEQGVELDRYGAAVAYHIRKRARRNGWAYTPDKWQRITKYNPYGWLQFAHIFDSGRGDQQRGVSRIVSAVQQVKMSERYSDTELEAAILAATYAMVVESDFGADSVFGAMGANTGMKEVFKELIDTKVAFKDGTNLQWNGVKIPHLFPGEELKQLVSSHPTKVFSEFQREQHRGAARASNMSYESYTGDYTNTTYSSARASQGVEWRGILSRRENIPVRTANMIFGQFLKESVSRGLTPLPEGVTDFWPNFRALTNGIWIGAGKYEIDGLKGAKTNEVKMRTGERTLQQVCADDGSDWEENVEQSARELSLKIKKLEENGITVTEEMKMRMLGLGGAGESLVFGAEQ